MAPSTLRYYEEMGLVASVARVGGRRQFDESALRRLHVIAVAKQTGFTIAEIRELVTGPGHARARLDLTHRKLAEVNARIARAEAMRTLLEKSLRCDCESLEECPAISGC